MPLRKTTTAAFGHFFALWCLAASAQTAGSDGPLSATFLGQDPIGIVPFGQSVAYTLGTENTDTAGGAVGTGVLIYVDGMLQPADSGVFAAPDCVIDPSFPSAWVCSNLTAAVPQRTFTLTWLAPGPGLHIIRFEVFGQRPIDNFSDPDHVVDLIAQTQITNPSAGLVERDLIFSGDGLVSFDESTGFEWLDLTATLGLSVTDVKGGTGGWIEAGWRHATEEEVRVMWASLGITHRLLPQDDYGELDAVNRFFDLFGLLETDPNIGLRSSQGWTDLTINNQFYAAAVSTFDDLTYANTRNLASASGRNPAFGNYLVREQATVALADGPYTLLEGSTLASGISILDNDRDPEGDPLSPIVVDPPDHASFFQVMPDGTFDYTHDGSETLSDFFTYRASDGVNESEIATVSLKILPVNDAPQISLIGEATIEIDLGATFDDPGATAEDPEDGDITANIVVGGDIVNTAIEGAYAITYTVTDSDGLAASEVVRTVIVKLDEPPVITLVGSASLTVEFGGVYDDPGAAAQDPEDGDLTNAITIDNPVDTSVPGTYTVIYSVEDSAGNQVQAERTVVVQEAPPPPPPPQTNSGGGGAISLIEVVASMLMMLALGGHRQRSASGR